MKIIQIFVLFLAFIFTNSVFSNPEDARSYSIVIYQGNCTSRAVMYEVKAYKNAKVVALAFVNSISDEKILGKNCNLKFNDGSVSMIDLCLQNLKNDYINNNDDDIEIDKNNIINIDSIIVGIAGYSEYKDVIYDKQITKLAHLKNSLSQSMQNYNFNCDNDNIKIMHDIDLINTESINLVEDKIIESNLKIENLKNIWTFFLESVTIGIKSSKKENQFILDKFFIGSGCYNLGKDSSVLFADVKDQHSLPTNKVQKVISESDLGKEIIKKRGQTFSYWLKENHDKPTYRNNARGLAVVEYALSKNLMAKIETNTTFKPVAKKIVRVESDVSDESDLSDSEITEEDLDKLKLNDQQYQETYTDASVDNLKVYALDMIDQSIDMLLEITGNDKDINSEDELELKPEDSIILVAGDLFNYDFIIKNYEKKLDEKVKNPELRSRIKLVNMDDFILGLVFASEKLK